MLPPFVTASSVHSTASLQGGEVTGTFEMDIYPIYRENLVCTGLESRIQDCSFQDDIEATSVTDELMNINCSSKLIKEDL